MLVDLPGIDSGIGCVFQSLVCSGLAKRWLADVSLFSSSKASNGHFPSVFRYHPPCWSGEVNDSTLAVSAGKLFFTNFSACVGRLIEGILSVLLEHWSRKWLSLVEWCPRGFVLYHSFVPHSSCLAGFIFGQEGDMCEDSLKEPS